MSRGSVEIWRDRLFDVGTIVVALAAVTVGGLTVWERFVAPVLETRPATVRDWRSYTETGNRIGPGDAPLVIVYFGDYQCPVCRRIAPMLDSVHAEFPNDVRIVHRHWPLEYHEAAYPAARAAECAAAQGRFAAYNTLLYSDSAWMDDTSRFEELATEAEVGDIDAFRSCAANTDPVDSIEGDILAVLELGGRGTPTIMINNQLLRGTLPTLDELRTLAREAADSRK